MKKNKNLIVFVIVSVLFAGLIFYGINSFAKLKNLELENAKKLTCGQLFRYSETLPNGAVNSYPMEKEYNDCIK